MKKIFHSLNDVVYKKKKNGSEKIGAGGFGSVKLVHHRKNSKILYAMKEILKKSPNDTKRIFQEIKLHKNLNHENIINFLDFLETKEKVYIFLEYASIGDLFTYVQKNKSLSKTELLNLFYQTCKGIGYIHAKDIMHRDLKPENILLDDNKIIKICDFGGSAEYRESESRETVCGTFEYMSPEVFFRNRQTKKTDIWALGILLFELFQGCAPFRGTRMELVMKKVMKNDIRFRKEIDEDIENLIRKILAFDPKKRPSIEDILGDKIFDKLKKSGRNFDRKNDNKPSALIYNNIKRFGSSKKCFKKKKNNFSNSNSKYYKIENKSNLLNLPSQITKPSINSNISNSPNTLTNKNSTSDFRKISNNSNSSKNLNQGDLKKVNFNVYENYRNIRSKSKKRKIYSKNNIKKVPKKKYNNSNSLSRIIKKSSTPNMLNIKKNSPKNLKFKKKLNYRTVDKKKQYALFQNHIFEGKKISLDNKRKFKINNQTNINNQRTEKYPKNIKSLTPHNNTNFNNSNFSNSKRNIRNQKNSTYITKDRNKITSHKYINTSLSNTNKGVNSKCINNSLTNNNKRVNNRYANNSLTRNVKGSSTNIYHKLVNNGFYAKDGQNKSFNQNYNFSNKFSSNRSGVKYRKNVSGEKKPVINTFGNYLNSLNQNFY